MADIEYMSNIRKFLVLITIFSSAQLLAGPEKYDHMDQYKTAGPILQAGPKEQIVGEASGEVAGTATYTYNNKGQLIQSKYFINEKSDGKTVYHYDKKGLVEEVLFDAQGKTREKIVYKRNSRNEITSYIVYDGNEKKVLYWQFSYKNGKVAGGRRIIDKEVTETFKVENRSKDISVQYIYTTGGEKVGSVTIYKKDDKVQRRVKEDNTGKYMVEYKYDEQGRLYEMQYSQHVRKKTQMKRIHHMVYSSAKNLSEGKHAPEKISKFEK
ncbi:MAG: hypothetical protein ABUK01_09750 [Leptospirales bacterium]